jgi:hypothetical protein
VAGDDQHRHLEATLAEFAQDGEAVHLGHLDVQHHRVG